MGKVIALDFDGVIHNPYDRDHGFHMGNPIEGAASAVNTLRNSGFTPVVFTANRIEPVEKWLDWWGFPIKSVTNTKPDAVAYIDDRAIRFTDWEQALEDVKRYAK